MEKMKRKTGHNIGYKKERVVLSDVLPYESSALFFKIGISINFFGEKIKVIIDEDKRTVSLRK
ncbi:hypothetical protein NV63_18595, partial [Elizabethkingia anophelis]